ncbi:hypothetical protein FB45DRAFT_222342 [Roridomyces roridus]|uniref:Uncharacterized protein n=1 Tax=Roridomyces roridus TaxID=1738132 RepID=A0AAD7BCR6_9AGAR|nr:hypothetical protein FB45DRAFT_222342 [Roridomyces roridus]
MVLATGGRAIWYAIAWLTAKKRRVSAAPTMAERCRFPAPETCRCPNSQWELPRLPPMQNPPATTHFMNPAAYGSYYTGGYYPAPMAGYPAPMTPGPSTPTYCAATYSQVQL